jgi:hypothetical protein
MHTVCGTVLRTSYADSDGQTGTAGNFPLPHAGPQHIHMAQVIVSFLKIMIYYIYGLKVS